MSTNSRCLLQFTSSLLAFPLLTPLAGHKGLRHRSFQPRAVGLGGRSAAEVAASVASCALHQDHRTQPKGPQGQSKVRAPLTCCPALPPSTLSIRYVINIRQYAKFVVALGDNVASTDVEEGMRVGVDRQSYKIMLPLPAKIDPTVTMMQARSCLRFNSRPALFSALCIPRKRLISHPQTHCPG